MTNKEWLLKELQNTSDEKLAESVSLTSLTDYCRRECNGINCVDCKLEWFKQEHKEKIKLSKAEKVILGNIDKKYEWLARDSDDELYIYEEKPKKATKSWSGTDYNETNIEVFNHLFKFIKFEDEEPYNIQELLDN